jgi:SAM-dependent methyltransferase
MTNCSLCGGSRFGPGYGGRLSPSGRDVACLDCGSAERHRVVHDMYMALAPWTSTLRALQFAPDRTLKAVNFTELVFSTYNGANSMDMMNTGLAPGQFDLIASNHVLEHVRDDAAALQEMLRVVGDAGVVHLCVPTPTAVTKTRDWGFPDPAITFHYRIYGADAPMIWAASGDFHLLAGVGRDAISETYEVVYWLSRNLGSLYAVCQLLQKSGFPALIVR